MLLLLSGNTWAQNVPLDSFYRDGATWTYVLSGTTNGCSHCWSQEQAGYEVFIDGDSDIVTTQFFRTDTVHYKLLYYRNIGGWGCGVPYQGPYYLEFSHGLWTKYYLGRIRVDNRKVYFTYEAGGYQNPNCWYPNSEVVWFDFGANVGDSILDRYMYGSFPCSNKLCVNNIDSLQLSSGIYIKKYTLNGVGIYYEGIGSAWDGIFSLVSLLFRYMGSLYQTEQLLCYTNKELSLKYTDSSIAYGLGLNCFDASQLGINPETKTAQEISLSPNPFNMLLHIANAPIGASIRVYDVVGRVVYSGTVNSAQASINTSAWERGTYIVELVLPDGTKELKKVVK